MEQERERFFSRLATIPGIRPMPSVGRWILLEVDEASDMARKVNRRLEPGVISVPRHVQGAVRVPVREPKANEEVFRTLRDLMQKRLGVRELARVGQADDDVFELSEPLPASEAV